MGFEYVSKASSILMGAVSLIKVGEGNSIEAFFRWLRLGGLLDFVYAQYHYIMAILLVIFLSKWIKDWRWLLGIGVAFLLFVQFVL
jgi:phosphoglycerol transferase MdoB-like AlkP superfamily enzyme